MLGIKETLDDCTAFIAAVPAVVSRGIVPKAVWVPEISREEITGAGMIVAPLRRELELQSRGGSIERVIIQAAIYEPLEHGGDDETAVQEQAVAQAIFAAALGKRIGGTTNALCIAAAQPVITSAEHWRSMRQFTSLIELTFI